MNPAELTGIIEHLRARHAGDRTLAAERVARLIVGPALGAVLAHHPRPTIDPEELDVITDALLTLAEEPPR